MFPINIKKWTSKCPIHPKFAGGPSDLQIRNLFYMIFFYSNATKKSISPSTMAQIFFFSRYYICTNNKYFIRSCFDSKHINGL